VTGYRWPVQPAQGQERQGAAQPLVAGSSLPAWLDPFPTTTPPPAEPDSTTETTTPAPEVDATLAAEQETWHTPLLPFEMPTLSGVWHLGEQLTTEYHPRDPQRQVGVAQPGHDDAPAKTERSGVAKYAIIGAIGGGMLTNAIDVARILKKVPEAYRGGLLGTALTQAITTAPAMPIINPPPPGVALDAVRGGMSFSKWDAGLMQASVALSSAVAVIQVASAVPNLYDALSQDGGVVNLAGTTSGRAGVLQLTGGGIGLYLLKRALSETKSTPGGFVKRVVEAGKAPIMANAMWKRVGIASGVAVMANELGYLDFLDKDNKRAVVTTLKDATHRTPVLNSDTWRSVALIGATAITAKKLITASMEAGALMPMPRGPLRNAGIAVGLLGLQLAGGLDFLNG